MESRRERLLAARKVPRGRLRRCGIIDGVVAVSRGRRHGPFQTVIPQANSVLDRALDASPSVTLALNTAPDAFPRNDDQLKTGEKTKDDVKRTTLTATSHLPPAAPINYLAGVRRYQQEKELGCGAFGVVVKAKDLMRGGEPVAIKLLRRGPALRHYRSYVQREIENQVQLQHPLIVEVREVFLTPRYLAIAMEYAKGGDLFSYITRQSPSGRLPEDHAKGLFQQLILGLDFCHSMGISSRDLKLENLLLDRNGNDGSRPLLKICDFGFSKNEFLSPAKSANVGTPTYMAPELLLGAKRYDGKKADIWSCAVILYAILFGQYPFDERKQDFGARVINCQYTIPESPAISPGCRDIITRMLVADPRQRMSMAEIRKHPFFATALPPGALDMNKVLLRQRPFSDATCWHQYKQRIQLLVQEASR